MPGYIKLYRRLLKWEWYSEINTKVLFLHILLKANFEDTRYKGRIIERGSFATSLPRLSAETGLTIDEVRTALRHLKSTNEVTMQTTNRESIIKVLNYNVYQTLEDAVSRTASQTEPIQNPAYSQPIPNRTEEEDKEVKNISSSTQSPSKKFDENSNEMKLCLLLAERMRRNNPDCKLPDDDFQNWCKHVDYMIRLDNRTPKQIQDMILFSQKDPFWQGTVLSAKKLRQQFDTLVLKSRMPKKETDSAPKGRFKKLD